MKIYAGVCIAQNFPRRTAVSPVPILASSIEEAIGKLWGLCTQRYPETDGWRNHHVHATEVPGDWYTIQEEQEHV